jgi:hypothetical protein
MKIEACVDFVIVFFIVGTCIIQWKLAEKNVNVFYLLVQEDFGFVLNYYVI